MKKRVLLSVLFLLLTGGIYFGINLYKTITYFRQKERINLVVYSPYFLGYSFDLKGNLNYILFFDLDKKAYVPGGYGYYYLGGLGKLAYLEKDLEILKNAFSYLYFMPFDGVVYKDISRVFTSEEDLKERLPGFFDFFLLNSDFNFYERIYLSFKMLDAGKFSYKTLSLNRAYEGDFINSSKVKEVVQGKFYARVFREEEKIVELYSDSYRAANNLKQVLEGAGIKVFNIKRSKKSNLACVVEESAEDRSITARFLTDYFNCKYKKTALKDGIVDIKLYLNNLSKKWE